MKAILAWFAKRKLASVGIGGVLAAFGGITALGVLQPAVEKASDYGAKAVSIYCELPAVDRDRFRSEVAERLPAGYAVRVSCPADIE